MASDKLVYASNQVVVIGRFPRKGGRRLDIVSLGLAMRGLAGLICRGCEQQQRHPSAWGPIELTPAFAIIRI